MTNKQQSQQVATKSETSCEYLLYVAGIYFSIRRSDIPQIIQKLGKQGAIFQVSMVRNFEQHQKQHISERASTPVLSWKEFLLS